jgi:DNA invertase Pin-like site-specific DNA recombinase
MRAVIYARYSSDQQREASIEDQVRLCRARIEREGRTPVATFTDTANGASRFRPSYQKILLDTRAGAFGIIVAEALDRLSRDPEDVAGFYRQLRFCGVKLMTVAEGEISELHVGATNGMAIGGLRGLRDAGEGDETAERWPDRERQDGVRVRPFVEAGARSGRCGCTP